MSKTITIIKNSVGSWPYPSANDGEWHEIDEDTRYQLLECLPPIMLGGVSGFFVGEPASHLNDGTPVHAYITRAAGRHFLREIPLTADHADAARLALVTALAED